jgi:L-serine dehydratase
MYNNTQELLAEAAAQDLALWQVILHNEQRLSGLTEAEIFQRLEEHFEVMLASAQKALTRPCPTVGSLIEGVTIQQYSYAEKGHTLCGSLINRVMARALSCCEVNASMGKVCAAPTAGACGILPAVLISVAEERKLSRRQTLEGLLTASGVGAIITKNATVSGAEGGCQAECGVAAAMAAAAAVQMAGGTPAMALHSCALALMNVMGLVCDPIAGLVQVPCAQRNASQAVNALLSADLALGGMQSIIPLDEVIEAMYRVGRMLPYQLRETALGGLAVTNTGKAITRQIFGGQRDS